MEGSPREVYDPSSLIITHFLHLQDELAVLVEPFRGRDPLSQSHNFHHQVGQHDGIEKDQRPCRRRDVEDRPPPAVIRGTIPVDVDDNGICHRRRQHVAPTIPCAVGGGGGGTTGESRIETARAYLLERHPRLRKFDRLGWHVKVPHGEYPSSAIFV